MAIAASTLIQRTRRFVRDYPEHDTLTASVTTSSTLTVADTSIYAVRWPIQVEQEAMLVKALTSGTVLTVLRGHAGTTAATHASGSTVLIRPHFLDVEILDALNSAIDSCFPLLYRPVAEEYTGVVADQYEYDVPTMTTISKPIPIVTRIEYRYATGEAFRQLKGWRIVRRGTPVIKLASPLPAGGTLRVHGFGPFAHFTTVASELDNLFPVHAEDLLPLYAAATLLASGEAGRVRSDTGAIDNREQANRTGSSMSASNALMVRFERQLLRKAMPPMPRHVKATF